MMTPQERRILCDNEDDPELTRAGALLLCEYEPAVEQMHLMIANVGS